MLNGFHLYGSQVHLSQLHLRFSPFVLRLGWSLSMRRFLYFIIILINNNNNNNCIIVIISSSLLLLSLLLFLRMFSVSELWVWKFEIHWVHMTCMQVNQNVTNNPKNIKIPCVPLINHQKHYICHTKYGSYIFFSLPLGKFQNYSSIIMSPNKWRRRDA